MARTEGARRALAVHVELAPLAVHDMLLDLAGVVRDVVKQRQARFRDDLREGLAHEMREDLPVGQRAVDRRAHGAEIILAQRGVDRRAGELAVGQDDAVARRGDGHFLQELGADLMPETARAAMDADHDVVFANTEGLRCPGVEDLHDLLYFEIMIAAAERAHLVALAFLGVLGDAVRARAAHLAVLLDVIEIGRAAVTLFHRPGRAARKHGVHFGLIQADGAGAAEAGRNLPV